MFVNHVSFHYVSVHHFVTNFTSNMYHLTADYSLYPFSNAITDRNFALKNYWSVI